MKIYILLFKEENTTNNRIKEYESQPYHQNQKITYDIYIRFEKNYYKSIGLYLLHFIVICGFKFKYEN